MTDLPLKTIVDYFKNLARTHKLVNSFVATENYDMNDFNYEYPLIQLEYPIGLDMTTIDAGELTISLNLSCITDIVYDENGVAFSIKEEDYDIQEKQTEILIEGLVGSDNIMSSALSILLQVVTKFTLDVRKQVLKGAKINSVSISNQERVYNSDKYIATASIVFRIPNPFACNIEEYFDINK